MTIYVAPHQTADVCNASDTAAGVAVENGAAVVPANQAANVGYSGDIAQCIAAQDFAFCKPDQAADRVKALNVARDVASADGPLTHSHQATYIIFPGDADIYQAHITNY